MEEMVNFDLVPFGNTIKTDESPDGFQCSINVGIGDDPEYSCFLNKFMVSNELNIKF